MLWFFLDWGYIRCCGCCRWRFRSYSESPFPDAGLWVLGLVGLGAYPLLRVLPLAVSLLQRLTFPDAEK